ncbi:MAG: hypothetical protein WAO35_26235 [Terriglobia bacterium]
MQRDIASSSYHAFLFTLAVMLILGAALVSSGCSGVFENEAEQFAKKYWNDRLTDCGASYVEHNIAGRPFVFEYKGVSVWVKADELTEADRLNGFEWLGQTGFSASSARIKWPNGGFGDWTSTAEDSVRMWKRKGQWEVERRPYVNLELHPNCALLK